MSDTSDFIDWPFVCIWNSDGGDFLAIRIDRNDDHAAEVFYVDVHLGSVEHQANSFFDFLATVLRRSNLSIL